jgi:16S rRNA (guanine1516-N2)-methyltransferase
MKCVHFHILFSMSTNSIYERFMESTALPASAPFLLPVACNQPAYQGVAARLAQQLQQPLLVECDLHALNETAFVLLVDEQGVALQQTGRKAPGPIRAEFTEGAVDHRRKFGGGKGQMIAKAVGIKAGVMPHVLDVTAGLGKDAFVLASLGCRVQLLERSSVVHALLADGLERANRVAVAQDQDLLHILQRMQLLALDSRDYLVGLAEAERPDVIYLDPMFPEREKTADVKKEMRAFHQVVGKDEDAGDLLHLALHSARYRVVVKRPRKAPFLGGQAPSYQLEGKSSRYDIYALKKLPDAISSAG